MVPDEIQFSLHIAQVGSIDHHSILFWDDDDKLSACTIGTKSVVTAAPHLIAVALHPVAVLFYCYPLIISIIGVR